VTSVSLTISLQKTLSQTNTDKSVPLTQLVGKMYADQGIAGFYRGVEVNVMRAIVLNGTKMSTYDVSKGYVSSSTGWSRKDPRTAFCSSFIAGFFMTCTGTFRICFLQSYSPLIETNQLLHSI